MTNKELADTFILIADLLEIKGESFYKTNAYRKAAESLIDLSQDAREIWDAGELQSIPGVGKAIAEKIDELLRTGELEFLTKLTDEVPESLAQLTKIPDLGPKKVKLFWEELGITTSAELEDAAKKGLLAKLPGMGEKSQAKVLAGIEALQRRQTDRTPLGDIWDFAQSQIEFLAGLPGVTQVEVAGSFRRRRETVGDLDILAAAENSSPVMEAFVGQSLVSHVEGRGDTKTSVEFSNGFRAQLWVHPPERFGTALQYATGSKGHNVKVREHALAQGYSLSEHALTREDGGEILCSTEEEVYKTIGLPYFAPEMREARGEVKAALDGSLPEVVQLKDIVSELHCHSTWSDGRGTIREMIEAALARGRKLITISDHSQSLGIANGLTIERLMDQKKEVESIRKEYEGRITILHGTEMEIKADGSLDFPDDVLSELDIVVASLHVGMRQPREQVTQRMLNAIQNPNVDIIGHPTNRLLPDRAGSDLDMEALFQAAEEYGTILEINANPQRLDLSDIHAMRALDLGILLAVNTDAHAPEHLDLLHLGVATARRAWATAEQVVNAWPVEKLLAWLEGRKKSS